jgi:hypothetical protein
LFQKSQVKKYESLFAMWHNGFVVAAGPACLPLLYRKRWQAGIPKIKIKKKHTRLA